MLIVILTGFYFCLMIFTYTYSICIFFKEPICRSLKEEEKLNKTQVTENIIREALYIFKCTLKTIFLIYVHLNINLKFQNLYDQQQTI